MSVLSRVVSLGTSFTGLVLYSVNDVPRETTLDSTDIEPTSYKLK
jgi:hypothetical protein